jgi:hypothetical protein
VEYAQAIWQKIEKKFWQKNNHTRIFQLQIELYQEKKVTQSNNHRMVKLHREKNEMKSNYTDQATTDLKELQTRADQDDIFQFLTSLDSSYENLRSQILLSKDLPSFDKVASMVQREELRRTVMNPQAHEPEETKVFISRYQKLNPNFSITRGDLALWCEHCKREGHKQEDCWFLHPELKPKKRGRDGGRGYISWFKRQWEPWEEPKKKKGFGAASESVDHTRAQATPASNPTSRIGEPDQDQMWHLMQ